MAELGRRGFAALALLLVFALLLALLTGPVRLPASELLGQQTERAQVVLALRGPRTLLALLAGAGLAAAGAALQTIFRNPLVSPDLLGVSSGASLGAVTALLLGGTGLGVQALGFAGGLAAALLTLGCARATRAADPVLALVLCGIVVGALASAGVALSLFLADPYAQLPLLTFWLLGSFGRAALGDVLLAVPPLLAAIGGLAWLNFRLDVLALGDDEARGLGLSPTRLRLLAIVLATLATAAVTALAGVVGWIGLLAPHIARLLGARSALPLIAGAALTGGALAVLLDVAARSIGLVEIPVGLLAALFGAPLFLALLLLRRPL